MGNTSFEGRHTRKKRCQHGACVLLMDIRKNRFVLSSIGKSKEAVMGAINQQKAKGEKGKLCRKQCSVLLLVEDKTNIRSWPQRQRRKKRGVNTLRQNRPKLLLATSGKKKEKKKKTVPTLSTDQSHKKRGIIRIVRGTEKKGGCCR